MVASFSYWEMMVFNLCKKLDSRHITGQSHISVSIGEESVRDNSSPLGTDQAKLSIHEVENNASYPAFLNHRKISPVEEGVLQSNLLSMIKRLSYLMFHLKFGYKIIAFFFIILSANTLFADASLRQSQKKYSLSICAVFRNEALYLKEWIEYHRIVGVDHFYLYNNGSTDRFLDVLKPYIKEGIVSLIHWPDNLDYQSEEYTFLWSLSTQVPAYENAMKAKTLHETQWMVFLDVNEFLVFANSDNLKTILEKYKKKSGMKIGTHSFDASASVSIPGRRLLIETVELVKPTPCHPHKSVAKVVFKPSEVKGFIWPPYQCVFNDNKEPITLQKHELCINRYENRFKGHLFFGKVKDKLHVDNRLLTEEESTEILEMGYEIEDQERPIYRFVPDVLKKMGYPQ